MELQDRASWWRRTAGNAGLFLAAGAAVGLLLGIPFAGAILFIPTNAFVATLVVPVLLILAIALHFRRQEFLDRQENVSEEG